MGPPKPILTAQVLLHESYCRLRRRCFNYLASDPEHHEQQCSTPRRRSGTHYLTWNGGKHIMSVQGNLCLMHIAKGSAPFMLSTATTTTTGFNTHCYMIPAGTQLDVAEHLYAMEVEKPVAGKSSSRSNWHHCLRPTATAEAAAHCTGKV